MPRVAASGGGYTTIPDPKCAGASGLSAFIGTPRVSKHRIFVWLDPDVLLERLRPLRSHSMMTSALAYFSRAYTKGGRERPVASCVRSRSRISLYLLIHFRYLSVSRKPNEGGEGRHRSGRRTAQCTPGRLDRRLVGGTAHAHTALQRTTRLAPHDPQRSRLSRKRGIRLARRPIGLRPAGSPVATQFREVRFDGAARDGRDCASISDRAPGPDAEGRVLDAIVGAASSGQYTRMRAAFAYASSGGAVELITALRRRCPDSTTFRSSGLCPSTSG